MAWHTRDSINALSISDVRFARTFETALDHAEEIHSLFLSDGRTRMEYCEQALGDAITLCDHMKCWNEKTFLLSLHRQLENGAFVASVVKSPSSIFSNCS